MPKPERSLRSTSSTHIAVALILAALLSSVDVNSQGLIWPNKEGVFIATSSATIPPFPRSLSGYRFEVEKDFWGKPFASRGSIRVFEGQNWQVIPKFPNTMNGCSAGVFMMRWRSADPGIPVESSARNNPTASGETKIGSFGYMSGSNCDQPMFKFTEALNRSKYPSVQGGHRVSYLVDVYYELKFWQAGP